MGSAHRFQQLFLAHNREGLHMYKSEITQIRQKIAEEYEAMQLGFSGFATGTAKHAFIDARMHCVDTYHEQLSQQLGEEEATLIICELYVKVMG